MTNEEIIKISYPFYDKNIERKDVELNGHQISVIMDAARKDEAIAFGNWCVDNYTKIQNNLWASYKEHDYERYTTEQLYQIFKRQTNG